MGSRVRWSGVGSSPNCPYGFSGQWEVQEFLVYVFSFYLPCRPRPLYLILCIFGLVCWHTTLRLSGRHDHLELDFFFSPTGIPTAAAAGGMGASAPSMRGVSVVAASSRVGVVSGCRACKAAACIAASCSA
jgi:hypothetical protein